MTVQRQAAEQVAAAINLMSTAALQVAARARSASGAALETDQQLRFARQVVDDSHTRIQALHTIGHRLQPLLGPFRI
ncbi:hypothetical protein [Pseudomonas syringae]|nr:hypothetical protein [Pseudomonas syringae]